MSNYTVTYNGIADRSIGVHCVKRPSVPAPTAKVDITDLRGVDGSYYNADGTYNDITIDVAFSLVSTDHSSLIAKPGDWMTLYRKVKQWLLSPGDGKLRFSDDYDIENGARKYYHYKVKNVSISNNRATRIMGELTASFTCDGYTYRDDGDVEMEIVSAATASTSEGVTTYSPGNAPSTLTNNFSTCHPLFRLQGSGTVTITVNGKEFAVTVNGTAYIDTDRMIVYNDAGEWVNFTAQGDYEDLWLDHGENSFDVSYTATAPIYVWMTPRWRCL